MDNYLIEHARKNVWCNPGQDNQLVFHPYRVTGPMGALNYVRVFGRPLTLPVLQKAYHILRIGQIDPRLVGLFDRHPSWQREKWYRLDTAVAALNVEVTVYNAGGLVLPRHRTYFMFTREKALIFAIEIDDRILADWGNDAWFLRFYTNAYFQEGAGTHTANGMVCEGGSPSNTSEILAMQVRVAALKAQPGWVRVYRNGLLINDLTLTTVAVGDVLEWVYDSSVVKVVTVTAADLHVFPSLLDQVEKYLVHHPSLETGYIDFQDDMDVHVLTPVVDGAYRGVYYNRNRLNHHRMVTHRDYSLSVGVFDQLAQSLSSLVGHLGSDLRQFRFQLIVRDGGWDRELIHDHNRIFELYKLSEEEVYQALIGLNATVPEWSARNLERSAYTRIMRSKYKDITITDVEQGYGYNSLSEVIGETPTKTSLYSQRQVAPLPYGLRLDSTVYEFDSLGLLLGWHHHSDPDGDYTAFNDSTRLIEGISGVGSHSPDVKYGTDLIPVPATHSWRLYLTTTTAGVPDPGNWQDITADVGTRYTVVDGKVKWLQGGTQYLLMVRTDATFLAYDKPLLGNEGLLNFSLTEISDIGDGQGPQERLLPVPYAQWDVWLEDKALVQDVDYILRFPVIHILNKSHLAQPADSTVQRLHIRGVGLPDKNLHQDPINDKGWVQHKALSNNLRYDLRDDKVLRITVGGRTYHRSDLEFYEDHPGIHVVDALNGSPYQIKEVFVPLKNYTQTEAYVLRDEARGVDKRVGDYLTSKIDTSQPSIPSSISARYPLVSPFFSRIVKLLQDGSIPLDPTVMLTPAQVVEICKPYEGLLQWDPLFEENQLDTRFVYILPHRKTTVVTLGIYEYRFLRQVNAIYGRGLVELSPFINFTV